MQSHFNTEKSEVKVDTGYLIGVPDIIWKICRRISLKNELRRQKLVVAFVAYQVAF